MSNDARWSMKQSTVQQADRRAFLATISRTALAMPIVTTLVVSAGVTPAQAGSPYGGAGRGGPSAGPGRGGGGGGGHGHHGSPPAGRGRGKKLGHGH
jgi:hypothetical protein